jgi:hypothetical protein
MRLLGPLRSTLWSSLLLAALLAGCERTEQAGKDSVTASGEAFDLPPPMSPGTLRGLGPHIFEASLDLAADSSGTYRSKDTAVRLSWGELDHYSFREVDAGRLVREEVRIDRDLYRRASETGPFHRLDGVPGDSLILQTTITFWTSALGPFSRRVAFDPRPDSSIEGRPVRVWRITLAPPAAPELDPRVSPAAAAALLMRATNVLSLSGSVYVDIETGNRLLAEIEGRFVVRGNPGAHDPTDEVHVTYRERRVLLDAPEAVVAPSPDLIRTRKIAPPPFHLGPRSTPSVGRSRG